MSCMNDWLDHNIEHALNHFGRTTEPKKVMCAEAWYKSYTWRSREDGGYLHYFANDLLGQRIPITEQQFDNTLITNPKEL